MTPHEFADAVLERLRERLPALYGVEDGPPQNTPPDLYVYVTTDAGLARVDRLGSGGSNRRRWTAYAVCVGPTAEDARSVASHTVLALLDWRPDGRTGTSGLRMASTLPPANEGPEGDHRWSQPITFTCHTSS